MSRSDRSTQRWLFAAAAIFVAAGGCTDGSPPTRPMAPGDALAAKGGGGGGGGSGGGGGGQRRLSIVAVNLSASSLVIDGARVSYTVTVENKGTSVSDVALQGAIVQGSVSQPAGGFAASCPPNPTGVVPKGSCQMTFTAGASNANGGGTLVPGAASFVLTMSSGAGSAATVADQQSVPVTLTAGTLGITNLAMSATTLAIGGAGVPYDVTIFNPNSQLSSVFIQGEIIQNGNVAGAAGSNLLCPPTSANGVLPTGTCTMSWIAVASNQSYAPAPLVPGAATFRLTLYQGTGSPVVLDTESIPVTLVAGPPEVTSVIFLDPSSNVLLSTTTATDYNVTLVNSGTAMTGMTLKGQVVQTLNGVTSTRNVSDVPVTCPSNASGTLPNGVCTFQVTAFVSNSASGSGPDLVPENDATYVVTLYQNGVEVATTSRDIHLKVQLF